jgi:hypothetical protein
LRENELLQIDVPEELSSSGTRPALVDAGRDRAMDVQSLKALPNLPIVYLGDETP